MANDAAAIARAAYEAYVAKDRAAIEALIADDFHFMSPLDNRLDRATYFTRCWPNSETTEGFEFIHLIRDGGRVFVTYKARGAGGHRFATPRSSRCAGRGSSRSRSASAGNFRTRQGRQLRGQGMTGIMSARRKFLAAGAALAARSGRRRSRKRRAASRLSPIAHRRPRSMS